jgi:hypothetical protein
MVLFYLHLRPNGNIRQDRLTFTPSVANCQNKDGGRMSWLEVAVHRKPSLWAQLVQRPRHCLGVFHFAPDTLESIGNRDTAALGIHNPSIGCHSEQLASLRDQARNALNNWLRVHRETAIQYIQAWNHSQDVTL